MSLLWLTLIPHNMGIFKMGIIEFYVIKLKFNMGTHGNLAQCNAQIPNFDQAAK